MAVELRPLGVRCNIACAYCYQQTQRGSVQPNRHYDMELMKSAVEREGGTFTLFGGEPLLLPMGDLEELWRWGLERYGENAVQTNGTLVRDEHIRMFKEYKVQVGISIDGPGELNSLRWAGSARATAKSTSRTEAAIERLCREGVPPTLIVTLHRVNASAEKLPRLLEWFGGLDRVGVTFARAHILETESKSIRREYGLTEEENVAAFLALARLERSLGRLRFDVFRDMRALLLGKDAKATCIWTACDPYTTTSVRGVEGMGQRSNCGRTNKDGIDYVKASETGYERYVALYNTPQDSGGCAGCRFFLMCKGQCPGTAMDGDWRNRTTDCEVWRRLLEFCEEELMVEGQAPISTQLELRARLEMSMVEAWSRNENPSIATLLERTTPKTPDGSTAR